MEFNVVYLNMLSKSINIQKHMSAEDVVGLASVWNNSPWTSGSLSNLALVQNPWRIWAK